MGTKFLGNGEMGSSSAADPQSVEMINTSVNREKEERQVRLDAEIMMKPWKQQARYLLRGH